MQSQDSIGARHPASAASPLPRRSDDFAYDGMAGRTRRVSLHVTMPDGAIRAIPAHRVVNVGTDPDLREPALSGALHRFESGDELALPFVYHDPAARKFALVLPSSLRHRELEERAALLRELAEDADHPIPPYVRHFAVVIGLEALTEYLALPTPGGSAVEAARREAELQQRETELAGAEAEMREREREVAELERGLRERATELADRERELSARAERDGRPSGELVGDEDVEEIADDADVEEVEEVDGESELRVAPAEEAELAGAVKMLGDEPEAEPLELVGRHGEEEAAELVDDAEVQEVEDEPGAEDEEGAETVDPAELSEVSEEEALPAIAELVARLEQADTRASAAIVLCRRGGPEELEQVRRALDRMTPDELAEVFGAFVERGEEAGDVLIRSLRAEAPYVRHGAALALGELVPQRALFPLLQLVRAEPEDLWQEAARVLGAFGEPALRALSHSFDGARGREERYAYALASLAERGLEGEVRALREKGDGVAANIAREAMTLRDVVRAHGEAACGPAPLEAGDAVRTFSRRFYEAVAAPAAAG